MNPTIAKYRKEIDHNRKFCGAVVVVEIADLAALLDIAEVWREIIRDPRRFQHIDSDQDHGDECAPGCLRCHGDAAIARLNGDKA